MFRFVICVLALGMAMTQLLGCQSTVLDRETVSRGLADGPGSNLDRDRIREAGEAAIPLILDELRANPHEPQLGTAIMVVTGMADRGEVDPKAPALRAVLEDTDEIEAVRGAAAIMLGWYWQSPETGTALVNCIKSEKSISVKADCIAALSTSITRRRGAEAREVDPAIRRLFADALTDKNATIRHQASRSIGSLAICAIREGVDLTWCSPLLLRARQDKEYRVRKAAMDMLLALEQEKAKIQQSGRQLIQEK